MEALRLGRRTLTICQLPFRPPDFSLGDLFGGSDGACKMAHGLSQPIPASFSTYNRLI